MTLLANSPGDSVILFGVSGAAPCGKRLMIEQGEQRRRDGRECTDADGGDVLRGISSSQGRPATRTDAGR